MKRSFEAYMIMFIVASKLYFEQVIEKNIRENRIYILDNLKIAETWKKLE